MAILPSIQRMLQRLARTIFPRSARDRLRHSLSKADYEKWVAQSRKDLEALRSSSDWTAIVSVLNLAATNERSLTEDTSAIVVRLVPYIPIRALPEFETRVSTTTCSAYQWYIQGPSLVTQRDWPPQVLAMFTLHSNGYVREAALRQLISSNGLPLSLPYLLLRLNDWVEPVRNLAIHAVRNAISAEHVISWTHVLGLLEQIRFRSRVDNSWLYEQVSRLFLLPTSRQQLREATESIEPAVARWAFATAMKLPEVDRADFVGSGLNHCDPRIRLQAATTVKTWKEFPGREKMLDEMKADPFMPVRRQALYAVLEAEPEQRHSFLVSALLDRHASLRHAARVYLREEAAKSGGTFDPREHYLHAMNCDNARLLAFAIAGVGESGNKVDVERLMPLVVGASSAVAVSAVRAVAALDRESHIDWFADLLVDRRPAVAIEAARALLAVGGALPVDRVRLVLRNGPHPYSRRLALHLLLRRHPYEAVVDAITAAGSCDPVLAEAGTKFIERLRPGSASYGPNSVQLTAAEMAIADSAASLPDKLRAQVHLFLALPARA